MLWKKGSSFFHTTTFRLTLWYLGVFSALSTAVFLFVYVSLALRLQAETDNELLDKSTEFATLYREHGVRALQAEFTREAGSQGTGQVFFQLLAANGQILASSDPGQRSGFRLPMPDKPAGPDDLPFYRTISLQGRQYRIRLLITPVQRGERIVIGSLLRREELILERYRETFGVALLAMVGLGGLFGFLLARKAMAGVQRVTDTATGIGRNDLGRRVPLLTEGEEINALARAFNGMLERIENLLGELRQVTDNVAHELRTPITRIRGIAETTMKGKDDLHEYKEMAASVIESCEDLVEMINTMLEIARTDSGTADLNPVPLDLLELITEAADLFTPMAEDKNIEIRLNGSAGPVPVVGDRRRLQRVMSNLLDNAVKYTSPGGAIDLAVKIMEGKARVEVGDTGIGIGEKDLPHIFERFYRVEQSRSTQGSGLGLSLARAIVHAHGGHIDVQSSDRGSVFSFSLPVSTLDSPS